MARFGGLEADKVDDKRALLAALAPLQHLAGRFCFQPINWRRLLVAGRALMRRARDDFTHSRHRSTPDVGIIERLAAQPLRHRLQIHVP